ncbi:Hypothetical protein GLP15_4323 [Giardia lamblia P15]|uniref:Uncharacterized protein n=1 Tax=Giardia intestinalis (strain P15) TaxID=658858 RepID=E1EWU7_GIAIA|nr:Hypothetical protein GLP15_4323 [Giardia lamblia P15]
MAEPNSDLQEEVERLTRELAAKDEKIHELELTISKTEPDRTCDVNDKSALCISRNQEGEYDDILVSSDQANFSSTALDVDSSAKGEACLSSQSSAQIQGMKKRMIMSTGNIEVPEEDLQQLRNICKDLIYSKIQGMSIISQACVLLEEYKQLLAGNMVHEATKPDDHLIRLNNVLAYQQARVQRCNALLMDVEHSMDSLCESKSMHLSYLAHGSQTPQSLPSSHSSWKQRGHYNYDLEHSKDRNVRFKISQQSNGFPLTSNRCKEVKIGSVYFALPTLLFLASILVVLLIYLVSFMIR